MLLLIIPDKLCRTGSQQNSYVRASSGQTDYETPEMHGIYLIRVRILVRPPGHATCRVLSIYDGL